jgi:hypothetical protein
MLLRNGREYLPERDEDECVLVLCIDETRRFDLNDSPRAAPVGAGADNGVSARRQSENMHLEALAGVGGESGVHGHAPVRVEIRCAPRHRPATKISAGVRVVDLKRPGFRQDEQVVAAESRRDGRKRALEPRGARKASSPLAPAVSPERPLGSRLEYPISKAGNRRHTRSATPIARSKIRHRPVSGGEGRRTHKSGLQILSPWRLAASAAGFGMGR